MNKTSNVFVVDDEMAVRESLRMMLKAAGYNVATFASADEFLAICSPEANGCVILDVNLPGMDGPKLQEELKLRGVRLPVIFLSGKGTIPVTVRTIKQGAIDFLTKPVKGEVLLERVREALEHYSTWQDQDKMSRIASARLAALTEREREVMQLVVKGRTSKEIAELLGISYRTVEIHRSNIMKKTGSDNILDLARLCSQ